MQAFKTQAVVSPDRVITLQGLPFSPGDSVEVIVLGSRPVQPADSDPLRGTLLRYDDPTAPVAEGDWEATK